MASRVQTSAGPVTKRIATPEEIAARLGPPKPDPSPEHTRTKARRKGTCPCGSPIKPGDLLEKIHGRWRCRRCFTRSTQPD